LKMQNAECKMQNYGGAQKQKRCAAIK